MMNFIFMRSSRHFLLLCGICLWSVASGSTPETGPSSGLKPFIKGLLDEGEQFENVRFADVVEATAGVSVLPVDPAAEPDRGMLQAIQEVALEMLEAFADPAHPLHQVGRINETSRHVEDYLLEHLGRSEDLECTVPVNASGRIQHSGYPDLRLEHLPTGRVFYIDPKVYRQGSERSTFRTFYFEPKRETNKILDDASHLILGVSHIGKVDGRWRFENWVLVDLAEFRVRLKAEFQASNRDMYRDGAVLLRSDEP